MSQAASEIIVSTPYLDKDPRNTYYSELLKEVLKQTEKYYDQVEISYAAKLNNERAMRLMINNNYGDILHGVAKSEWEEKLIPVRIPLLKGLNGLRVLFINKQEQTKFSQIETIDELKKISGGLGHTWAITEVAKLQGFKIVTSPSYDSLFTMLEKGRYHYFSRGLYEVLEEFKIRRRENEQLHIEETILLNIPLPVFFYVNPNKPMLAARINEGLHIMKNNGSFNKLYTKHFGHLYDALNLSGRKLFTVDNPMLSEASQKVVAPVTMASFN